MADSPIWQARLEPAEDQSARQYCEQHGLSRSQAVRLGLQLLRNRKQPPKGGDVAMGSKPGFPAENNGPKKTPVC